MYSSPTSGLAHQLTSKYLGLYPSLLTHPQFSTQLFCFSQQHSYTCGPVGEVFGTKISKNRRPVQISNSMLPGKPLHRFLRGHIRASGLESQLLGCTTRKVMTFPSEGLTDLQGPGRARSLENYVKSSL